MQRPAFEHVILVDDDNQPIGTADKAVIHDDATPVHRGFSVFLFDREGRLLLQQRSRQKTTWPGVWSNSCCGHPQVGESTTEAMQRRIHDELGIAGVEVTVVLPNYRYRYAYAGIVENEFCPVAIGMLETQPSPNPDEVEATRWIAWEQFLEETAGPNEYSDWCVEESRLLVENADFQRFYRELRGTN